MKLHRRLRLRWTRAGRTGVGRTGVGRIGAALLLAIAFVLPGSALPSSQANRATPSISGPLDINTATADQLKDLPGMGAEYAKRIIASRPYSSKNQLVTKGILPRDVYDKIKDWIVAHRGKAPHSPVD